MAVEKLLSGVLDGEEAGVRRTAEGTGADERAFGSDGDAGEVGVGGCRLPLRAGVGGEGLGDDGVEVGVAAAEEEVLEGLPLDLGLEALGAEGEGVEVGREDGVGDAGGKAEDCTSAPVVDAFELVVEDVVEVAGFEDELFAADVLVDADVVGAGALGGRAG